MQKKIVKTCLNWEILLPYIIEAFYTWFQCLVLVDVILRLMFCNSKTQMENVVLADYLFRGHTRFLKKSLLAMKNERPGI